MGTDGIREFKDVAMEEYDESAARWVRKRRQSD